MVFKAVLFDIYGTLVDIETDERDWYVYLNLAKYLGYRGINLSADEIRLFYFEKIHQQIERSHEKFPEIDVRRIWREILTEHETPQQYRLNLDQTTFLSDLVVLHRALTRKRFRLYDSTMDTLKTLKTAYKLGIVSDAQPDYAIPELKILGIHDLFEVIILSGDYGFRKPDHRLYRESFVRLGISPHETVFVGNDTYRDISGAKALGMKTMLLTGGYGSKDDRQGKPDFKLESLSQLQNKLHTLR